MATQNWDIALLATIVSATGAGDTTSSSVGSAGTINPPQQWDFVYWDGVTWGTGVGNTNSTSVGSATAENATWYDITGTVGTGGSGVGNTLSQAADFAPFTVLSPPSVTGFGETISSSYGTVLRSFNTIGQETEGGFGMDQQTTDSILVRPTARGDFIIDGLPLPS